MPSPGRYRTERSGPAARAFTFVEVLAALVIVSISLLGLLRLHVTSMAMADTAQATSHAVLLARQKLAEAAVGYPEVGVATGVTEQGNLEMRWRTEVGDCELPELVEAGITGMRQVKVDITWNQGVGEKHLQMSTCVAQRKM